MNNGHEGHQTLSLPIGMFVAVAGALIFIGAFFYHEHLNLVLGVLLSRSAVDYWIPAIFVFGIALMCLGVFGQVLWDVLTILYRRLKKLLY